jgi:hypothetical protein
VIGFAYSRRTEVAGIDIPRAFLGPLPEPLRDRPMPRRHFAFTLLLPCAVTVGGGVLFIAHELLERDDRRRNRRRSESHAQAKN